MQGATHLRFGDLRYERHFQVPSQTILSGFKRLLAGIFVNAGQNLLDAVALFPQVETYNTYANHGLGEGRKRG